MDNLIRHTKPTSLVGLLLFGSAAAHAQTGGVQTPAAPPPATAGVFNDWLRQQNTGFSPFDLGAQFRMRYVDQTYFAVPGAGPTAVDFRANTPVSDNDFLLLRTRVHAGWSPTEWFTVYGAGQNSADIVDARTPAPQADGPFDLQQGYVKLGGTKSLPVSLKLGRQELAYGDERLVGASDWDNIGRTFDAAKLHYEQGSFWVDAFSGRVVIPKDDQFNQPNWDDWFSGVYASTRALVPNLDKSQTAGRNLEPKARSAGFQPAVSQISNLRTASTTDGLPNGIRRYSRLETCATNCQRKFAPGSL